MRQLLVAFILVCTMVSVAQARNVCVQVDSGSYAGSLIVMKKVNLGAKKFGPIYGFLAYFASGGYQDFYPLDGSALSGSTHELAVGLSYHNVGLSAGGMTSGTSIIAINILCNPGPNQKIDVVDSCSSYIGSSFGNAHVVECNSAPSIP